MARDWQVIGSSTIDVGDEGEEVRFLTLAIVAGRVDVLAHDEPTAVVTITRVEGPAVDVRFDGATLTVEQKPEKERKGLWNRGGQTRADISVTLSRAATVEMNTVSANVLVHGLNAAVTVNTVSGEASVADVIGDVSLDSVSARLAKLTEEGLLTRTDEGRSTTYTITDAGRAELAAREGEVELIDTGIDTAAAVADVAREAVRSATADLKREIKEAASRARADRAGARFAETQARPSASHESGEPYDRVVRGLERTLRGLDRELRALERIALRAARRGPEAAAEVEGIVAEAEARLAAATARVEQVLDR